MSKSNKSNKSNKSVEIEIAVETPKAEPKRATVAIAKPHIAFEAGSVTDPRRKLTRDEWRALSPEEKRARKDAKRSHSPVAAGRLAKNLTRFANRVTKLRGMVDPATHQRLWSTLDETLTALNSATSQFNLLPNDWKPVTTGSYVPKAPRFTNGDTVAIHTKRRSAYNGLLSDTDMTTLQLVKIVGKRVVCVTKAGAQLFLPLNVITKVDTVAAAAE